MSSVNKYLTKAKVNPHAKDKYERLGLRDNPFPFDPVLDPDSENVRINGAIYCESIKEKEISLFKEHFFQQELNGNHRRLGYLIDSSYTGRGNGKSALLVHLQKQTDADFGFEMTGGQNKIFSLYVKPEPSGKTVKFWQLSYLLIDRLTKMSILSDCIISLSYDYALSVLGEEKLSKHLVVEDDFKKLLDYKFLGEIGVGDFEMKSYIDKLLSSKGVDKSIINALLRARFEPEAGLSLLINSKNESLQKKEMSWIFFDQLVRVFVASGFNGCCIFFDEFEKMVEPQKLSERNDFAAELRHNLLDGGSLGTVLGFYMMVLAMHPGVPNIITESWEKSGVNVRCPLPSQAQGIEQQHTVFFNNLQKENVREMIGEYLNYFRVSGYSGDKLFPFTAESIDYIAEAASFNAAKSLKIAYNLIDKVSNSDSQLVDEQFIRRMAEENQQASSVDNGSLDFLEKKSPSPLKGIIFNQIK